MNMCDNVSVCVCELACMHAPSINCFSPLVCAENISSHLRACLGNRKLSSALQTDYTGASRLFEKMRMYINR